MRQDVQATLAVLVCAFCIAGPGAGRDTPVPPDVAQGQYVSVHWAELTHGSDGWQITGTHEIGNWNSPLRAGDLVLNVDGVDVSHLNPLSIASLLEDAGLRDVTVTVKRQGRTEEVEVHQGRSQPDEYMEQFYQRFGIGASLTAEKKAAAVRIILDVIPGSPAERTGLKDGDELLAVDGHEVAGVKLRDVAQMVSSTRPVPVELRVRRGTETLIREVSRVPISQLYKPLQPAKIAFPMQTGLDAPTFKLQDMKNNWVSLVDLRGKWVLLTFWGTWCLPCRKEVPVLNTLTQNYSEQLAVLALDVDDKRETLEQFIATNKVSYRVLIAGKPEDGVVKSYNVRGFPENVIVSPDGKVRYVEKAFSSASPLEDYIRKLKLR
jgi:peroxiredoxin